MLITDRIITNKKQLKKKCSLIKTEEIKTIKNMAEHFYFIMEQNQGIGLAAPQIGISKRFFIMKYKEDNIICINPEIIYSSPIIEIDSQEGCLSVPGKQFIVKRSSMITVKYIDLENNSIKKDLTGYDAIICQHEFDHLDGILISDKGKEIIDI